MIATLKRRAAATLTSYPKATEAYQSMGVSVLIKTLKALRVKWLQNQFSSPYEKRKLKLHILKCREALDSKLK